MTAIKLDRFSGMLPAWDDRLLPEGQASYSLNAYLFSGSLQGWRQPKLLRALLNTTAKYVYRIPNRETNDTNITALDSKWLEFPDPDTTVMRTPVVDDQYQRYYAASPSDVPRYNSYQRIMQDQSWWMLGVPASGCAPGVTITGGGDTSQLGFATVGPTGGAQTYVPGNEIVLVPIVPDGAMLIQDVAFSPVSDGSGNQVTFRAVVYDDINGKPYQLLGVGNDTIVNYGQPSQTGLFSNSISVDGNLTYWIGVQTDAPYYLTSVDNTNRGAAYAAVFSNGAPDFLNVGSVTTSPSYQVWSDLFGASVFVARAYVYTWVTEYGEEGPPSLPSVVNGWSNGTWNIELFTPTLNNMGGGTDASGTVWPADRNIKTTRIYRSITNQSGQGTYFFVAEIPVTQASYVDTIPDNVVALNQQLLSYYWFGPPADMQGIVPFPNGNAVGWRSNELWFSEAYRPHAWPAGYVLTTEFPIIGVGVCGQSIVVCTQGSPYVASGVNPSAMALTKVNLPEPCLHRASIVSTDTTVLYVSQNGLIQISQSGAGANVTEGWITRERWQALTPHQHIRAIKHATSYFAFGGEPIRDGFTVELSAQDQTSFTVWPQPGGHRLGFMPLSSPNEFDIDNLLLDPWTGIALLVQAGGVWYYDFTDLNPVIVPYKWRSKIYQQMSAKNFAAVKVWFTVPGTTPEQVDRDTDDPQPVLGPQQYGILRVYADDELYTTRELRRSGELLRIYSGEKVEAWQFEVEGRVAVSNLQVATSVKELGLI
jgi:hypothetical protein